MFVKNSFCQKYLDTQIFKVIFILTLQFFVLFNSVVIFYEFNLYKASFLGAILTLIKTIGTAYIFAFLLFLGFSFNNWALYLATIFLYGTGAAASYYMFMLGIPMNFQTIRNVFDASFNEAAEMVDTKLIIWICFAIFVGCFTIYHFRASKPQKYLSKIFIVSALVISLFNIISPFYNTGERYFPMKYLSESYRHFSAKFKKKVPKLDISVNYNYLDRNKSEDDLLIVLVVGESARPDHFGVNGYHRNTTPHLSKIPNLISYSRATSCATCTYLSVPCMITRATSNDPEQAFEETSVISVFRSLGYQTHWYGTQSIIKYLYAYSKPYIYDEPEHLVTPRGTALLRLLNHDETLLPYFDQALGSDNGRKFIVLHTQGSHWNYNARYPESYTRYTPNCLKKTFKIDPSSCALDELVNAYDNSILYTDYFLSEVIARVKNKNAIVIYASDHGQSLGEEGRYMHGNPEAIEQYNIPMIVWASDSFIASNDSKWRALQSWRHQPVSHDFIFHSLLDAANIESDIIDPNLSLFRSSNHKIDLVND